MEVRVLDISGQEIFNVTTLSSKSIKDLRQVLAKELDCDRRLLKLLGADGIASDAATVGEASKAAEGQAEVTLTLVRCTAPVSITGSFEQFEENWQIVPTAANDPHGTYLYDPGAQVVTRTDTGVILTSRGRVASLKELELSKELVITGNFRFTGSREDFLSVHYGVRPLHTGRHPYGGLDDGSSGICVNFNYGHGKITVDVAGQGHLLESFRHIETESECRFRISIDPSADCVAVLLEHGEHEVSGAVERLGLSTMGFPGRNVAIYNREFRGCHCNLWGVEVCLAD